MSYLLCANYDLKTNNPQGEYPVKNSTFKGLIIQERR